MRNCRSGCCRICGSKHYSLLHLSSQPSTEVQRAPVAEPIISVQSRSGAWIPCRTLLDSGSQVHIVTNRLAHQLQLPKTKSTVAVAGLGDACFNAQGASVCIKFKSHTSNYCACLSALVAPAITDNQPSLTVKPEGWKIPANIQLADPEFYKSQRIDLLIGASMLFELLSVGQIKLAAGLPLLQKTRLGWIVTGGGSSSIKATALQGQAVQRELVAAEGRMDELVRRFWEVESCEEGVVTATKEELACEAHFMTNFRRLDSENKLQRKPEVKVQYSAFIREYLDLNHMSLVPKDSLSLCKYFLPHHCVFKEDSTTTKLRVVFDGSAKTSISDFPVALTGDVCKMYRCVRVAEPDSYFQCILWRDSPDQEVQVFKLDTVTYGTKPAAFLPVRTMHQLASDEKSSFPIGSKTILRDFYVGDLITGGKSAQEVLEVMSQTTNLLSRGGFKLRKWCSNDRDVFDQIADSEKETFLKFDDGSGFTKTLGLAWDPAADVFRFSFSPIQVSPKPCKRLVLSTIARIYDPLGLIGPVVAKAKIFLQEVWREKLEWDESSP
ncbi:uncharacterized protein LOC122320294 [Drosophila ficusphila]|uniref:uncharacterized protein LOC122320294 n=1 Tax=Drosophila ficusphila TaxID=30025 RepID=UPI001C8AF4BF|nr:uncharacterized protein LOC122320294 [Drosophila ficusphila]